MMLEHDMNSNPTGWRNSKRSPDLSNAAAPPATNGEANGTRNDRSSEASSNSPTTPAATAPFVYPTDESWKIVGSPPRKNSIQGPLPTMPQGSSDFPPLQESGYEDEEDADLRRMRGRAASTPGTPNRHMNGIDIPNRFLHSASPPGYPNGVNNSNDAKWGSLGFQWAGPSIWTEGSSGNGSGPGSRTSPPPGEDGRNVSFSGVDEHHDISAVPMVPSVSLEPSYRQQRSLSFSMGQNPAFFGYGDEDEAPSRSGYRSSLPVMEEEDEYPQYGVPKFRSRSKSSGAAFGLVASQEIPYNDEIGGQPYRRDSEQYSDLPGGWNRSGSESTVMGSHRRSVTTNSGYSPMWDNGSTAQASNSSYLQISSADHERLERLRAQRRFSLAPAPTYHEYGVLGSGQDMRMLTRPVDEYSHLNHRRHSVAGTSLSFNTNHPTTRYLSDALESLDLGEVRETPNYSAEPTFPSREFMETVDEYFDNDDHRTRAYHDMGKGIPLHQVPHHGPLYVVEFKAGRTDLFYVAENSGLNIKKGDLVIVEADRGKDLGKVTVDNLTPQQVQLLQAQQADVNGDTHRMNKELHPKRIYRLAQPAEVTMLMGKSQDEAKAMMVCQTKVRQKKLPMEVVDAEYQWDRRKLTFYFIAERRIDFRELVRDLFKIYKTRIWMCAVNPLSKK